MKTGLTTGLVLFVLGQAAPITGPAGRYVFDVPAPVRITQEESRVILDWSGRDRPIPPKPDPDPDPVPDPRPPKPDPFPPSPQALTELEASAALYADAVRSALLTMAKAVEEGKATDHAFVLTHVGARRDMARDRFGKALNLATVPAVDVSTGRIKAPEAYAAALREAARAMPPPLPVEAR